MTCLIRNNITKLSKTIYLRFCYSWCLRWTAFATRKGGQIGDTWNVQCVFCGFPAAGWLSLLIHHLQTVNQSLFPKMLCKFQFTSHYCRHIAEAIMDNVFESSKNMSFSFSICIPAVMSVLSKESSSILLWSMWIFTGFYSLYFFLTFR